MYGQEADDKRHSDRERSRAHSVKCDSKSPLLQPPNCLHEHAQLVHHRRHRHQITEERDGGSKAEKSLLIKRFSNLNGLCQWCGVGSLSTQHQEHQLP